MHYALTCETEARVSVVRQHGLLINDPTTSLRGGRKMAGYLSRHQGDPRNCTGTYLDYLCPALYAKRAEVKVMEGHQADSTLRAGLRHGMGAHLRLQLLGLVHSPVCVGRGHGILRRNTRMGQCGQFSYGINYESGSKGHWKTQIPGRGPSP